jgi:hypothetical protein
MGEWNLFAFGSYVQTLEITVHKEKILLKQAGGGI